MENIKDLVIEISSITTGVGIMIGVLYKINTAQFKEVNKKIEKMDYNQCKTYLTEFLADVECNIKKDQAQIMRACEVYDHYVKDLKGNSYIQDKWERLIKK